MEHLIYQRQVTLMPLSDCRTNLFLHILSCFQFGLVTFVMKGILPINLFQPNDSFLYPLKTSESQRFSDIFRGYGSGTSGQNGLIDFSIFSVEFSFFCSTHFQVRVIEKKGRGVFSTQSFKKGDLVCEYAGDLIDYKEAKTREAKYGTDETIGSYMYFFEYQNKKYWQVQFSFVLFF